MIVGNKVTKNAAGGQVTPMIGPNPRRVGMIFGSPSTSSYWVAMGDTPGQDDGLRVVSGTSLAMMILFDKPNDWITQPVNVFCPVGEVVSVVELVDREP